MSIGGGEGGRGFTTKINVYLTIKLDNKRKKQDIIAFSFFKPHF